MFEGNYIEQNVIFVDEINSTNNYALELIHNNTGEEGMIVRTSYQTQGRGQLDSEWESEKGKNLLVSIILKPATLPAMDHFHLNRSVSIAIMEFIAELISSEVTIKWPNDIMVGNDKVGGILIENIIKQNNIFWSVLGIGINVNQIQFNDSFKPNATSLKKIIGNEFNLEDLTGRLFQKVAKYYSIVQLKKFEVISKIYSENLFRVNIKSKFHSPDLEFEGTILGVQDDGKLVIRKSNGEVNFFTNKEIGFNF